MKTLTLFSQVSARSASQAKVRSWSRIGSSALFLPVLAGLLSSQFFCACSDMDERSVSSHGASTALSVVACATESESATRSGGTAITTDNAKIRLFQSGDNGYAGRSDVPYDYSTVTSKWSSTTPIYVDKRECKIFACYDPTSKVTFGSNSTMTTNAPLVAGVYNADDSQMWYYDNTSAPKVNNLSGPLSFNSLKRAYSLLSFNISRNAHYPGNCKVSEIQIKPTSGTLMTSANMDIKDGTTTATAQDPAYTMNTASYAMGSTGIVSGTPDTSLSLLFPPQACGSGLTFTLTVDGTPLSVAVPGSQFSKFEAGVRYTVMMEIAGAGVSAVTIPDSWTLSNVDNGGGGFIPVP